MPTPPPNVQPGTTVNNKTKALCPLQPDQTYITAVLSLTAAPGLCGTLRDPPGLPQEYGPQAPLLKLSATGSTQAKGKRSAALHTANVIILHEHTHSKKKQRKNEQNNKKVGLVSLNDSARIWLLFTGKLVGEKSKLTSKVLQKIQQQYDNKALTGQWIQEFLNWLQYLYWGVKVRFGRWGNPYTLFHELCIQAVIC